MGASSCASAFPDGVPRNVLPEPELAGAHPDASGGGWCQRHFTGAAVFGSLGHGSALLW